MFSSYKAKFVIAGGEAVKGISVIKQRIEKSTWQNPCGPNCGDLVR